MTSRETLRRRTATFVLCAVLVAAAFVGYLVPTSEAQFPHERLTQFYGSGGLVGETWRLCDGTVGGWGMKTTDNETFFWPCS